MLEKLHGFRGVAAMYQTSDGVVAVLARDAATLRQVVTSRFPEAGEFDDSACRKSILISDRNISRSEPTATSAATDSHV